MSWQFEQWVYIIYIPNIATIRYGVQTVYARVHAYKNDKKLQFDDLFQYYIFKVRDNITNITSSVSSCARYLQLSFMFYRENSNSIINQGNEHSKYDINYLSIQYIVLR